VLSVVKNKIITHHREHRETQRENLLPLCGKKISTKLSIEH
jgi:hypothetical protein